VPFYEPLTSIGQGTKGRVTHNYGLQLVRRGFVTLSKELLEAGDDLVDLHALMTPRPGLVSGGVQDRPRNWKALNHLVAVNHVLGHEHRVALTARPTHVPTPEALELELAFLEYWLKPGGMRSDGPQSH
jgi:hypothetical protein